MSHVLARALGIFLVGISLLYSPSFIFAEDIPYHFTDGVTATPPSQFGTYFGKTINIPYHSGKMILSSTPDGTGAISFQDRLGVSQSPDSKSFIRIRDCNTSKMILPPTDITHLFTKNSNFNNISIGVSGGCALTTKTVGPIYIVNVDADAPPPFLDLPWDYRGKGLSFEEASGAINSWFDHEYPFLSVGLSFPEKAETRGTIINYKKIQRNEELSYSSHDGYDWGKRAKALVGEPQLAAAAGVASYFGYVDKNKGDCIPCGNQIQIDHENGFQTRYFHLMDEDKGGNLVVSNREDTVRVEQGQMIGRIGYTGNIIPASEEGAHIHFMVVHDKNNDGNFDDNIPDGLVDPFGWEPAEPDPWENYMFNYGGQERTGNKSHYLWKTDLQSTRRTLPRVGGRVQIDYAEIVAPNGSLFGETDFEVKVTPVSFPSAQLKQIGVGISVLAWNVVGGNLVTSFGAPLTITIDFTGVDLSTVDTSTLSIYSSSDGTTWTKEEVTVVDFANRKATVQVDHLTEFAIMAERLDAIAPITTVNIIGELREEGLYNSDVEVSLTAEDNEGGQGVEFTFYSINEGGKQLYTEPFSLTEEGEYKVLYYSIDNDENVEEVKAVEFAIDKTFDEIPPELNVQFDPQQLKIAYVGVDSSGAATLSEEQIAKNKKKLTVLDESENLLLVEVTEGKIFTFLTSRVNSLKYGEDTDINPGDNLLAILYGKDRQGRITNFAQSYVVKGEEIVVLIYTKSTDKTVVIKNEKGEEISRAEYEGIKLLQVYTESGTVKYRVI